MTFPLTFPLICLIYVSAMCLANLSVSHFGPWVSPINSFVFIGLDLALRDHLHDRTKGNPFFMGGLIAVAAIASYLLNPASGTIAVASLVAFTLASTADWAVYSRMSERPFMIRSNSSNIVGAAVDSVVFPALAFGAFMPGVVLAQFAAKAGGGFVWSVTLRRLFDRAAA